MLHKLKKLFTKSTPLPVIADIKKPKTDKEVDLAYIDVDGNHFYLYRNVTDLPFRRHIAAEIATKQAEFNLTKEKFEKLLDAMIKSMDDGKYAEVATMLYETKERLAFAAEEYTLLQLASVFTLMNDENGDHYYALEQKAKQDAWQKDDDAKDFFLRLAFNLTKTSQNISDIDILAYLKEIEQKVRFTLSQYKMNQ